MKQMSKLRREKQVMKDPKDLLLKNIYKNKRFT